MRSGVPLLGELLRPGSCLKNHKKKTENVLTAVIFSGTNDYGYSYHFDIMASSSALGEVLGDNPVVNFTEVTCPSAATTDYDQCVCATTT